MAKQIITASTDATSGLGYFLTKLWAKIKELFYTKTETDNKLSDKADAASVYTKTETDNKLSAKQATITGAATTITASNLTASRALVANASGKVAASDITSTELGYLDGVTSNVQTQLNGKASTSALTNGSVTKVGTATKGSSTQPIYLSSGSPTACSTYAGGTKVTLNGTDKGAATASFYAPASAGTKNYLLLSNGSGAPTWTNTISPAAIELFPGSTSAGHGGYIDFHYNNSEEDCTARIIEMGNYLGVAAKPLTITGCTKFLGVGDNYTVAAGDKVWFICSHGANTITLPNGGGWTGREIYIYSPMNSGNKVAYYTNTDGTTMGTLTITLHRNKMYRFMYYDGNGWTCDTPDRQTAAVSADTTPTDASVTMYQGTATCTLTLTNTLATAIGAGNDIICFVKGSNSYKLTVRYHLGVSGTSYGSVAVSTGQCVRLVAVGGAWGLQV